MNKLDYQLRRLIDTMHEAETICNDIEDDHGIRIAAWDHAFAVVAGMERLRAHFAVTCPMSVSHWLQTEKMGNETVVDEYTSTPVGTFVARGRYDANGRLRFREAFEVEASDVDHDDAQSG